uniref:SEA domain-containing protein n=1 Tax=Panagrolaimus sp. JU765 TaxID=591449 RepID=A0AC34QKH6_9BILA
MRWPVFAAFLFLFCFNGIIGQQDGADFTQITADEPADLDAEEPKMEIQPGAPKVKVEDDDAPTSDEKPQAETEEPLPPEMTEQDPFATTAVPALTTLAAKSVEDVETKAPKAAEEAVDEADDAKQSAEPSVPISPVAIEEEATEAPLVPHPAETAATQKLNLNEGEISEMTKKVTEMPANEATQSANGEEDVFAGDKTLFQQEQTMKALTEEFATAPMPKEKPEEEKDVEPTFPIVHLPVEKAEKSGEKQEPVPEKAKSSEVETTTEKAEEPLPNLPMSVAGNEEEKENKKESAEHTAEVESEKKEAASGEAQPSTEPTPEPAKSSESGAKAEAAPEPTPEPSATPEPAAQPEPTTEPAAVPESSPEPAVVAESTPEPEPKTAPESAPEPKAEPSPEPEPTTTPEPTPEPKPAEPETESKPEPSPEPEAKPEPSPEPEPKAEPTPEPVPESSPEPTPEAEPKAEPSPEPEPKAEPTPEPEPKAEPSPEPEPKAEPEPTAEPTPEPTSDEHVHQHHHHNLAAVNPEAERKIPFSLRFSDIEFNDEFKNPESGSFKKLSEQISHDFKKVLTKVLGDNFVDFQVLEMRPGSVVVDGQIVTKQEVMDSEGVAEQVEQVINANGGTLGGNKVDTKSISINGFVAKGNVELISDPSASKTGYVVFGAIAIGILIIATAIIAIIIFGVRKSRAGRHNTVSNRRAAGSLKLKDDANLAENGTSSYKTGNNVNLTSYTERTPSMTDAKDPKMNGSSMVMTSSQFSSPPALNGTATSEH